MLSLTRRDLLRLMLASAAAEVLDVERLLWAPKPIITVPSMPAAENWIKVSGVDADGLWTYAWAVVDLDSRRVTWTPMRR